MAGVEWVDVVAGYFYGLKFLAIGVATLILFLGLDDLLIDLAYWVRRILRMFGIYRRVPRADQRIFGDRREQPIALMIPAWKESGVIQPMLKRAVESLDYENYHIFVGTYPNDPETIAEVDAVCRRNPNVHRVSCARPGPTTKADCLNNIIVSLFDFERRAGIEFAGFVLHDAEDVIGELELRLFNHLLPRKDLIQLPVYPLPVPWYQFTSWHYADEFAEQHGKDLVVRESLAGQVPSAGVGTCFSRKAMLHLMESRDGRPFDVSSLTEDYEIAIRLHQAGLKQCFVRFPRGPWVRRAARPDSNVIAIQELFPDRMGAAIRQKSRWIIGIMLQGWRNVRWQGGPTMKYFLWRDRRGLVGHPTAFLANFLLINIVILLLYQALAEDPYRFLGIFGDSTVLMTLIYCNVVVLANRVLHRIWFVSAFYGGIQGLWAVPRLLWGNLINFCAMVRAVWQFLLAARRGGGLRWDKTTHAYPEVAESRPLRPLGEILIEQGRLERDQLEAALTRQQPWERLGRTLLRLGWLSGQDLALALAEQVGVPALELDPREPQPGQAGWLSAELALRYAVVPVAREGELLVVARESQLPAVQEAALRRRLGRPVHYGIAPPGSVTVALRAWYRPVTGAARDIALWRAVRERDLLDADTAERVWQQYLQGQYLLGESLVDSGILEPAVCVQALLGHEHSELPLGEYLVRENYLSRETLDAALEAQREQQPSMTTLLREAGVPAPEDLVEPVEEVSS